MKLSTNAIWTCVFETIPMAKKHLTLKLSPRAAFQSPSSLLSEAALGPSQL